MFTPFAIAWGLVVYPRQELEVIDRHLCRRDAELVIELAHCRPTNALYRSIKSNASLPWYAQRVRTASIGPHVRKRDLLGCTLLQEKPVLRVEEEDGESAME
jgi:hypothetical protein